MYKYKVKIRADEVDYIVEGNNLIAVADTGKGITSAMEGDFDVESAYLCLQVILTDLLGKVGVEGTSQVIKRLNKEFGG